MIRDIPSGEKSIETITQILMDLLGTIKETVMVSVNTGNVLGSIGVIFFGKWEHHSFLWDLPAQNTFFKCF